MKIKLRKDDLVKTVGYMAEVTQKKSIQEIISHLLIEVTDKIIISATDLEKAIFIEVEGEIIETGTITINAKKFNDTVKAASEFLTITTKDNDIKIYSNKRYIKTQGFFKDDFPAVEFKSENKSLEINSVDLLSILNKVQISIHTDPDAKPYFTGIFIQKTKSYINFVGSDGHRLSFHYLKYEDDSEFECIIPLTTINVLRKILANRIDFVKINLGLKNVKIKIGDIVLLSRIIPSNYPDYKKIIPDNSEFEIKIKKETLVQSLKWIKPYIDELGKTIIKISGNEFKLMVSSEYGKSEDTIILENNYEDFEIPVNYKYLIEFINVSLEEIHFKFINDKSPVVVQDVNKQYIYILMPMRS